ncbi:MAG TPA: hypothetical protein DIW30_00875 [Bacteroidales bacterium]|nr:hypothetical protein [Bacteroidales bacterium]
MKKLTATILSMSVLTVMAGAAIAPALDIIGAHFSQAGVHEMTIKLIVSFPALFIILTNLFFHTVSRRLSTKTIALLGLTVYILCGAGCYLTDNIVMLLLLRALLGVSVGLLMPLSTGLLAYYFAPEEQARLMGLSAAMNQLGGVIATAIAGVLASSCGWRYAFLVYLMGIPAMVLVVLYLPAERIGDQSKQGKTFSLKSLVKFHPSVAGMLLLMMTFFVFPTNFAQMASQNAYLGQHHGAITAIMVGLDMVALAMGLLFEWLMKHFRLSIQYFCPVLFLFGYGCYCLSMSVPMLVIGSILAGMATGIGVPYLNTIASIKGGRTAATTVMPLLSMALYLGQFASPLVVSPLAEWWFPDMPQASFAVGCLLSLLLFLQVVFTRHFQSLPTKK